jgi:hypothetical protein
MMKTKIQQDDQYQFGIDLAFLRNAKQCNRTTNRNGDKLNKIKYVAVLLIGVACVGLQQARAISLEDQMHWSTNDPYLIGTVIPGAKDGGQAQRDAAMTSTLLGMAIHSQMGSWGDQDNPCIRARR